MSFDHTFQQRIWSWGPLRSQVPTVAIRRPTGPSGVAGCGRRTLQRLRSIDWVESFLHALVSEGFSDASAVAGYRAFTSFLLGHLLLEVATHGADVGPLDVIDDGSPDYAGLADYPLVRRLRPALSEDHAAVEFEESLENLLDQMGLIRSEDNAGSQ